jgi:hypothetical protein
MAYLLFWPVTGPVFPSSTSSVEAPAVTLGLGRTVAACHRLIFHVALLHATETPHPLLFQAKN